MIQSLFKVENLQKASMLSLKPGQFLYGRVEKFLPDHTAIIQIGDLRLFAHLKTSLSSAESYWFEVRSNGDEGIQLKVVEGKGQNISDLSNLLMEQFHLPATKRNLQPLQYFLKKNLPFTKEQLRTATAWMNNQADSKEITALEIMIKKDLPFTRQTFQSLIAVQETESFYSQLERLQSFLENPKFESVKSVQQIKQVLSFILSNHSIEELGSSNEVKHMMQNMVSSLGLEYESEIKENQYSLKPLLMRAITELGAEGKKLEPVVNRLTGMQLLSQDLTGPMHQIVMQLPITFGEKQTDVTLQWSGRKTKTGQIDPDFCRILFYLDLQSIHQTVIDMQIQNRVIHAVIINDTKNLGPIITALTPTLKKKLESLGYQLSFIKVMEKNHSPQSNLDVFTNSVYQGVDLKV
jgi:hypothetical protein